MAQAATAESLATREPEQRSGRPSIQLRDIYKLFGEVAAVNGVSLEVRQGEFLTLLGPSGCGKTTTLRMIGGFELPSAGDILIEGEAMGDRPPYRRPVNTVFQNYALFPHMTVAENVAFGLRMRGWSKADQKKRVDEYISLVRLDGLGDRKPGQLSGGQQQRVAVARALAFDPDLVLLDEPLSNLDAKLREQVRLDVRAIQRRAGQTTIFVTHDQVEALVMSDRVVLMNQGAIEQIGPPQDLYTSPATEFAARFIGANNLIPSHYLGNDAARADGVQLTVTTSSRASGVTTAGQPVWICVRPEQVTVWRAGEENSAPAGTVTARLRDVIFQGTTMLLDADAPGIGPIRAECPPAAVAHLRPGEDVTLTFASTHLVPRDLQAVAEAV